MAAPTKTARGGKATPGGKTPKGGKTAQDGVPERSKAAQEGKATPGGKTPKGSKAAQEGKAAKGGKAPQAGQLRKPPSPHDPLFRWLPQDPVRAKAMVCDRLPPQLASKVVAVRRLESTFISDKLKRTQSDGLLQVEFVGGELALAYVVFEHKARPGAQALYQLVGSVLDVWQAHAAGDEAKLLNPPPVLPILYYHGKAAWDIPSELQGMHPFGQTLFGVQLRCLAVNLTEMPVGRLSSNAEVNAGFHTMLFATGALGGPEKLAEVVRAMPDNHTLETVAGLYIIKSIAGGYAVWDAALIQEKPERRNAIMQSIDEQLEARGEARGWAEGEAIGRAEAKLDTLTQLLRQRFGKVPRRQQAQLRKASVADLDAWSLRVLDAPSLQAVFAD